VHIKIAPSILSADFGYLADQVRAAEEAGADYIHLDVMDGHFVPNLTIGPDVVASVRRATSLPLDVHLMIESPETLVNRFVDAGADIITVHQEVCRHLHQVLAEIHGLRVKAGVAINPATPVETLSEVLGDVDQVLVMTVNPGFGGQATIPSTIDKTRRMADLISVKRSAAELEVDGGISPANVHLLVKAGARIVVAGSSIFNKRALVAQNLETLRLAAEDTHGGE
jgi:ribulose-phosphate 3-epimerase